MKEESRPAKRLPTISPRLSLHEAAAGNGSRVAVWTGRTLGDLPDNSEADMLVGPLVVRGARTIIVGDTGHGKTTLAAQLAAAVLTGGECLATPAQASAP